MVLLWFLGFIILIIIILIILILVFFRFPKQLLFCFHLLFPPPFLPIAKLRRVCLQDEWLSLHGRGLKFFDVGNVEGRSKGPQLKFFQHSAFVFNRISISTGFSIFSYPIPLLNLSYSKCFASIRVSRHSATY